MTKPKNIPPGYEAVAGVTGAAIDAFTQSLHEDPSLKRRVLQDLTTANTSFALSLLQRGKKTREHGIPPDTAYVAGALFVVGCITSQEGIQRLRELFKADTVEGAEGAEATLSDA